VHLVVSRDLLQVEDLGAVEHRKVHGLPQDALPRHALPQLELGQRHRVILGVEHL
jgi:hypothetical protein